MANKRTAHPFLCTCCGFRFDTMSECREHERVMEGTYYPCQYCGEWYMGVTQRSRHERVAHKHERKYSEEPPNKKRRSLCNGCGHYKDIYGTSKYCDSCIDRIPVEYASTDACSDSDSTMPTIYCGCCNKQFDSLVACKEHEKSTYTPQTMYPCRRDGCESTFRQSAHRCRHEREVHDKLTSTQCHQCGQQFRRHRGLKEHLQFQHGPRTKTVICDICNVKCTNPISLRVHKETKHDIQSGGSPGSNIVKSAFKGYLTNFRYLPNSNANNDQDANHGVPFSADITSEDNAISTAAHTQHEADDISPNTSTTDAHTFFTMIKPSIKRDIAQELEQSAVKFILTFQCLLYKWNINNECVHSSPVFQSQPQQTLSDHEVDQALNVAINDVLKQLEEYQRNGSGWVLDSVVHADLHVGKYQPLKGSRFMALPNDLKNKHALINVQNLDEFCFIYCILAHIYPAKSNANRPSNYAKYITFESDGPKVDDLNLNGLNFPLRVCDIDKFEIQNSLLCINVYSYAETKNGTVIYPLRISKSQTSNVINLLYLSDENNSHYILIKSLSRLLNSRNENKHYCPHCLHGFKRSETLRTHLPYCQIHSPQRIVMPSECDNILKFKDGYKQMPVPYILIADFECSIVPQPDGKDLHQPNSFCLYKVDHSGREMFTPFIYVGEDASAVFAEKIEQECDWILKKQQEHKQMNRNTMSEFERLSYNAATVCHICNKNLKEEEKVRDHCHVSGDYRGAAHRQCNIRYTIPNKVPLFIHNFSNYDLKIIVEGIRSRAQRINVIPENLENYISMDVDKIRFLDSYRFLDASLQSLVDKMKSDGNFNHTITWLREQGHAEHIDKLLCKNSYPYEWVNSAHKFNCAEFPKQSDFYSKITRTTITNSEYTHALDVYTSLSMKTFLDYHTLYLALDVLLLSDVIENFRKRCLTEDGLDPARYFTMPNYAFDAMLKSTKVELELLSDPTMYLAFENGIWGGISVVSHRHKEANNPYLDDYDDTKPTSYILYEDAVNLYGKSMTYPLPISDFRWLNENEINDLDVTNVPDEGEDCYILEVDLSYPDHLHDDHSIYPLIVESFIPTDDILSPYCRNLKEKLGLGNSSNKLIPNLLPKNNYLVHYRNLKFYLKHGIVLDKIHRVIYCKQRPWLKEFVMSNTEKRKQSKNTLDKDFYKKKTNSVYGKCEQNPRKYQRVDLVNHVTRVRKLVADPTYISHKIFYGDDDGDGGSLAAIHRRTTTLKLNKPIYAGFSILELSKLVMFEHYYDFLRPKYGDKMTLCYTDTDSLIFSVYTDDIYKDMKDDQHLYDTSDYQPDHFLYSLTNKKVPGKFSDETHGIPIKGWVALRSKVYAIKLGNGDEKRRAKGIPRRIVQNEMLYDDYVKCLQTGQTTSVEYSSIQSKNMRLFTTTTRRSGLSGYDDKRWICDDGMSTLAYGHYAINKLARN